MGIVPKDKPVVISAESYAKKNVFRYSFVNPKILGLLTVILLLVSGVGAGVYMTQTPKQTQTQATLETSDISFKPSEIQVQSGKSFSVDVFGNANGNQITSVKLAFQFDPEVLELISISPKQFLPKVLATPSIASGSASVSLGTDGNSGISGSGILASLSFHSKKQSASLTRISFDKGQTRIDLLGNTTNPLSNLKSAAVIITPGSDEDTKSPQSASESSVVSDSRFDFNSDSKVNSIDLSVLYSAWGNPQSDIQKKADLNADGAVNGLDYSLFLPQMQK